MTETERTSFLEALSECANVSEACRASSIGRSTVYRWRDESTDFAAEWDRAVQVGVGALEDEAIRRAYKGTERPVYQGGQLVGTVREYSDTLLIFLLKGAKPEKYRDNHKVEHTGDLAPSRVIVNI